MASFWRRESTIEAPPKREVRTVGVPPLRELIVLGWNDYHQEHRDPRTGNVTVRETRYRLLCHRFRRSRWFVQWADEDGPIEPLVPTEGPSESVTVMRVSSSARPQPRFDSGAPERVVPLDEYGGW